MGRGEPERLLLLLPRGFEGLIVGHSGGGRTLRLDAQLGLLQSLLGGDHVGEERTDLGLQPRDLALEPLLVQPRRALQLFGHAAQLLAQHGILSGHSLRALLGAAAGSWLAAAAAARRGHGRVETPPKVRIRPRAHLRRRKPTAVERIAVAHRRARTRAPHMLSAHRSASGSASGSHQGLLRAAQGRWPRALRPIIVHGPHG